MAEPNLKQWGPPEFSAMLPPRVQADWLEGSGAKKRPCGAAAREISRLTTPVWQRAVRSSGAISRMRFIRVSETTTPPESGVAPPESPVPAPRAVKGTPAAAAARTTAAASPVVRGRATASGALRKAVLPSHS